MFRNGNEGVEISELLADYDEAQSATTIAATRRPPTFADWQKARANVGAQNQAACASEGENSLAQLVGADLVHRRLRGRHCASGAKNGERVGVFTLKSSPSLGSPLATATTIDELSAASLATSIGVGTATSAAITTLTTETTAATAATTKRTRSMSRSVHPAVRLPELARFITANEARRRALVARLNAFRAQRAPPDSRIDVYWVADDGGLTLLVAHLLRMPRSYLEVRTRGLQVDEPPNRRF